MVDTITNCETIFPLPPSIGLRDGVAERLLVAILSGNIEAGDRLVGRSLAERLGVSVTPVREALIELATLGFVELLPNRGAVCREFGLTELREIFQIRCMLETEAAFSACGRIPTEQLQELRHRMLKLSETIKDDLEWSARAMAADSEFHEVIQKCCKSRRLAHEVERYNSLMRAIRRVTGNLYNVQLQAVSEHLRIIEAYLAEDAELVRKRMIEHIESTAHGVAKVMFLASWETMDS